jgi:hypothetical protein
MVRRQIRKDSSSMTYDYIPIEEPPEGWCNELFKVDPTGEASMGIAPIIKWYYCRLPKGHETDQHSCYAFRLGK